MDQLTSMQVFRQVVDSGSFALAGQQLGISAPMVSKHVAQLEKRLGARLLNRSSRHLSLTEAGQRWYAQSIQALEMLDAAAQEIGQHNQAPRGQLKVSAPVWCATPRMALAIGSTANGKAVCTRPINTPFWLYSSMIGRLINPRPISAWLSIPPGPRITSQP